MKTTLGRLYQENWENRANYAHCRVTRFRAGKGRSRLYKNISHWSFLRLNTIDMSKFENIGDGRRVHLVIH